MKRVYLLLHLALPAAMAATAWAPTAGAIPLLNGLGGDAGYGLTRLDNNDDGSSTSIAITAAMGTRGANFFGTFYTSMFVNNNGNITFRGAVSSFTPTPFPISSQPMIAPWWGDVDTRPPSAPPLPPTNYGVYYDVRPGQVTVTWHNVGFFSQSYTRLNDFQLILFDRSTQRVAGDFDVEFRYNRCEWMAGTASGSDATGQCTPSTTGCTPAQAGFDAGDQRNFDTLPGSRTTAILNLCTTTNAGTAGLWRFQIRGGGISECGNNTTEMGEECDDGNVRPGDGCSASCRTELAQGASCTTSDQCRTGFCVDGVCCGSACAGQCEVCNATGSVGTCTAVSGAPRNGRPACAGGESVCAGTCDGTLRERCGYPGMSTACGAASCMNGSATAQAGCNGLGACIPGSVTLCAPFVCGETACRTSCASDTDCTTGNYCNAMMRCVPKLPPGGACTGANQCASGNCVDGVCCNTACNGQCEACNLDGSAGTCTAAVGAPRGARTACAGAGTACGGRCDGTQRTACVFPDNTVSCRSASCSEGAATTAATCDGMGACPAPSTSPCAPYACGEAGCLTRCSTNDDCAAGNICENGMCTGRRPNGGMCQGASECESGHCVDGVCCNTACNGQCEACDTAGMLGTCNAVTGRPHGARTACQGEGACGAVCDGSNRMACAFPGASTACRSATCEGGVATAGANCDGMGACPAAMTTDCMGYACGDTSCRTACSDTAQCAMGYVCEAGRCVLPSMDAGVVDAGPADSGPADSGASTDLGPNDAGARDAGKVGIDSGNGQRLALQGDGCACRVAGAGAAGRTQTARYLGLLGVAAAVAGLRRRRR
ncbi:MAG: hypothetical protein JNK72_09370 [Myxococcales bacterium]|nr:hypothetical protein [Myxococcales bacterium]